ncbi:hypothetical protein [Lentzea flaviverrucosa]|uniref:Uncharacterized protein n=1 Tax=Lentzea flaviverrucosa TaxID=200379 RepID=A0A1H9XAP1_9PSEU|nr:hypothetical protein [Lentzea flaviverrucosa]RDI21712.1 hypothetical protein DFR72_113259 [Lentzea flaviverrucosa]SES42947.1 hypothetical protein SAMN05216195_11421 [Lentzea flaviverrucosa]
MTGRKNPKKVLAGRIGGSAKSKNAELEQRTRDELARLQTELAEAVEAVLASAEERLS